MSGRKIIAVVGATGAQGGGLVRAILEDSDREFAVRAIVRDIRSPRAQALMNLGAELAEANLDDEAALRAALSDAYGAYFVTFFWDHFSPEREMQQAGNMARAARDAGIDHAIWSTLEDTRQRVPLESERMPTLMGKYKVPHFDAKGASDHLFCAAAVPTTFLLTSFYWDNFIHFGLGPKRGADGELMLGLPMGNARLPGIAAEDIGRCAYGIFRAGPAWSGKTVGISGEHLTGGEMAQSLTRALGEKVRYQDLTPEAYRALGFPGADDLGNMFQFKRDFETEFCRARDVAVARSLNPRLQNLDGWLAQHAGRIPLS